MIKIGKQLEKSLLIGLKDMEAFMSQITGKIDGIILDVDGTLWDSTPIVAKAWTKAVRERGCTDMTITADMLKKLFGRTMTVIADLMLPQLDSQERYEVMELCCAYEHEFLETDPCEVCYPGVIDTIKKLAGQVNVFIVSNCQSGYIELFLKKTGLKPYVTDIECYGNTRKSKGENLRLLVERNELHHPVYVGDTQGDCDASREAGLPFVFASYGFGEADARAARITQFADLLQLVQE